MCNGGYFIMYPLCNFWPVKGFKCRSNVGMFRGASDSAGRCIFNLLKAFNLCERKFVVKRVTIIKKRMNEGSGDSSGSGKVKCVPDTTKVTNVVMAGARKGENLFGKRKVRVKDEFEVPNPGCGRNGLCGSEGK